MYGPIQSFFLYCAHHIRARLNGTGSNDLAEAANRRLILPFGQSNFVLRGSDDGTKPDVVLRFCGIGEEVEPQGNPHYCIAGLIIECKRGHGQSAHLKALSQLGVYEYHVVQNQCDRSYAIGLTFCDTVARVVIIAHDVVWVSTGADVGTPAGRRQLIGFIVDASICSVDRLGLDTTIERREQPLALAAAAAAPAAAALGEGQHLIAYVYTIDRRRFYGWQCQLFANRLTRQRRRYIPVSTSIDTMGTPTHMIIDDWAFSARTQRFDTRDEAKILRRAHAQLRNTNLQHAYPQVIRGHRVFQRRETAHNVEDNTWSAFGILCDNEHNPNTPPVPDDPDMPITTWLDYHFRAHKRIVILYPGAAIYDAENALSFIIALADSWTVCDALYTQLHLLHRDIIAENITIRMVEDRTQGKLLGFSNTIDANITGLRLTRSGMAAVRALLPIHVLEYPNAAHMPLDDGESLLYLICWMATFGINEAQRREFAVRYREGGVGKISILGWTEGNAADIAECKRTHMTSEFAFGTYVLSKMPPDSPLRPLALDIYRALFNYPGSYGTTRILDDQLQHVGNLAIETALRALPSINGTRDPYMLRDNSVEANRTNLRNILVLYRARSRTALGEAAPDVEGRA
ncbi:hypothetical protein GGI24_001470 [Coemansia furcata]|nr:hypothetical protein GGI24_001470 [Coemansia furcata]